MRTRLRQWGKGMGVCIPKTLAAEVGLRDDSPIELRLDGAKIVIEPCVHLPRLGDLLEGIRPDNVHREVDTGPASGDEVSQSMDAVPERDDVVWISMTPHAGHEQSGQRPALVLSPAAHNAKVGLTSLCSITNQVKGYPFEGLLHAGIPVEGVVLSDQTKSLDWRARRAESACRLPPDIAGDLLLKPGTLLPPWTLRRPPENRLPNVEHRIPALPGSVCTMPEAMVPRPPPSSKPRAERAG
ncbi:MAG: type II toxin-antitoxin system PemK/MazF family toxin [Anaerolineales bacterium]|nr:type II toxin-antitoxin system PemK/MazF family toxin [Anaerolineales bacterium]